MSDHVWVSKAMTDPDFERRLTSDIIDRDIEAAIEASRMNKDGQPVPQDMCPKRLVSSKDASKYHEDFDNAYQGYEPPLANFSPLDWCYGLVSGYASSPSARDH